ncbi:purine permease 3-like [Dioscorea cayenensis subsp. rotundata]|uniref:Probable purine permease n=1 Tax=Dioscorea cayennensis subsp. rotundata TaxID=55577 RepID=A0AB40CWL8_DIOCR|nr:purine permease 3-like [Dioscorea cayenensis subsp. rotundata]
MKEIEAQQHQEQEAQHEQEVQVSKTLRRVVLTVNFIMMFLGCTASPLLLRLYFVRGGHRIWLSSWIQTAGFPIVFIPLIISYYHRRKTDKHAKPYLITQNLFLSSLGLGILIGIDNLLYAYGVSYLPISTSSILISTQLGFTALFAFFIVKQKFTACSINAVALLSFGALILGLNSDGDRPEGESKGEYFEGFFMTLGAAILYAFVLPVVELTYTKANQAITYTLVMEMQLVMGVFATAFCTVGMFIAKDFQVIPREGKAFGLGEFNYYQVLVWSAILWQFCFLGIIGAIHYTSALVTGIFLMVLIPVTEVFAIIFFHEEFNSGKGISLALFLWGFVSYFYGELKAKKKKKKKQQQLAVSVLELPKGTA